ncbi:hypothetical protein ACIOZM_31965, partial [Pseudomonas sp. NPDC087346]|uniref:hypothetical protein n=1 Tax=Pseudomonas sp. NPDC087346 TaxID=3364438 RepID=UPI0037F644CF
MGVYQQRFNAAGVAVGGESQVNTFTANNQGNSRVVGLTGGGWLVTWTSDGQDGSGWGVYQQRYDANGTKVGAEVRVNAETLNAQGRSDVVGLAGGGWVVIFEDNSSGIYVPKFQVYDANGVTLGSNIVVTNNNVGQPTIAYLTDGGWVIAWGGGGLGDDSGIFMQAYNADGSKKGVETRSNTYTTGVQSNADITGLADGGWLVSWGSETQDGSGVGIYQQRYDVNGLAQGPENRVNTVTAGDQQLAAVTALKGGGWVVAWQSNNQLSGTSGNDIYQQRYDAVGNKQGVEQLVNESFTVGEQTLPNITATADGGWTISWVSAGQDGSGLGVYQRHYLPSEDVKPSLPLLLRVARLKQWLQR